jgi:hypothetical protein
MNEIPATLEVDIGELRFKTHQDKMFMSPYPSKLGKVVHVCHPSYLGDGDKRITI